MSDSNDKYIAVGIEEADTRTDKWPSDLCDRQSLANEILSFLRAQTRPLTIAIDGRWGSGKSFFVNGFAKQVEEKTESRKPGLCMLLNAWESDSLENPLLYLYYGLSKAVERMPQYDKLDPQTLDVLKKNLKSIGTGLLDIATGGGFGRFQDAFSKNCDRHPVALYDEEVKLQRDFKSYLSEVALAVYDGSGLPLVVCVDELDRCKPTYAVEMLECIKHFFSVPHVVFVLAVDLPELRATVQSCYGCLKPREYLRRFIQYVFRLPILPPQVFLESVWKDLDLDSVISRRISHAFPSRKFQPRDVRLYFELVVSKKGYTPRQVETLLRMFAVGFSDDVYQFTDCILLVILSVLYLDDPESFDGMIKASADAKALSFLLIPHAQGETAEMSALRTLSQFVISAGWAMDSEMVGEIYKEYRKWGETPGSLPAELRPLAEKVLRDLSVGINGWHRAFKDARVLELSHRFSFTSSTNTDWAEGAE